LSLVLFNGAAPTTNIPAENGSYLVLDLDGKSTRSNGFFVIGNSANLGSVVDLELANNTIQNGADAVALYQGDYVQGDAPTNTNLLDAIVYGTDDDTDQDLLDALGEIIQYNVGAFTSTAPDNSLSRFPDGTGDFIQTPSCVGGSNTPEHAALGLITVAGGFLTCRRRRRTRP
jgi:MYXO-CTERM domain-containing protein